MVEIEREGRILTLILSYPEKLNALHPRMVEELRAGLELANSGEVNVLVLAGRGPSFCAGGDMESLALEDPSAGHEYIARVTAILATLRIFPKPIVAAVQGYAVGGGAEIAFEADLIVLSKDAVFRFPDVGIGSTPATLYQLARLVGKGTVARMALLGEDLLADLANQLGLAYRVVSPEEVLPEAMSIARRLDGLSPLSLRMAKQALRLAQTADPMTDLQNNLEAMTVCYDSAEQRAAVKAFFSRQHRRG